MCIGHGAGFHGIQECIESRLQITICVIDCILSSKHGLLQSTICCIYSLLQIILLLLYHPVFHRRNICTVLCRNFCFIQQSLCFCYFRFQRCGICLLYGYHTAAENVAAILCCGCDGGCACTHCCDCAICSYCCNRFVIAAPCHFLVRSICGCYCCCQGCCTRY